MLDADGNRVLPVYYDDNYVALLPGEARRIEVLCPAAFWAMRKGRFARLECEHSRDCNSVNS